MIVTIKSVKVAEATQDDVTCCNRRNIVIVVGGDCCCGCRCRAFCDWWRRWWRIKPDHSTNFGAPAYTSIVATSIVPVLTTENRTLSFPVQRTIDLRFTRNVTFEVSIFGYTNSLGLECQGVKSFDIPLGLSWLMDTGSY